MQVNVLFFAALREQTGCSECVVDLPAGSTVSDAMERSGFSDAMPFILVAVNETYVERTHPLVDGDTVALIPPLGGG
tara:strand:- start:205 stop:435 length:231 start_codon:yes stop_codon:yes gene_type:complete